MAYSTTLGRWVQMDPIAYEDGLNGYQFVVSNPIIMVDPLGLEGWTPKGGTTHDKFGGKVALPDGSKLNVEVITGATLDYGEGKSTAGPIVFQVTSDKGTCDKCHFIQFVRRYRYDNDNKFDGGVYPSDTYMKYGDWYLDTSWKAPDSVWYDTYGEHAREKNRLSIADAPSVAWDEAKHSKVGAEFQLFLVCGDKVMWKWTWRAEVSKGKDGRWSDLTYMPQSGGAASDLGEFKDQKDFAIGYSDAKAEKPIPRYTNPLK